MQKYRVLLILFVFVLLGCGREAKIVVHNHHDDRTAEVHILSEGGDDSYNLSANHKRTTELKWGYFDGKHSNATLSASVGNWSYFEQGSIKDGETFDWHLYPGGTPNSQKPDTLSILKEQYYE